MAEATLMAEPTRKPVVQTVAAPSDLPGRTIRMGLALFVSIGTHVVLLMLFLVLAPVGPVQSQVEPGVGDEAVIADAKDALPRDAFDTIDVDPAGESLGGDIVNDAERKSEFTVPGLDDPSKKVGARDGDDKAPPVSYPAPRGFGDGNGGGSLPGIAGSDGLPGGQRWANPYAFRTARGDAAGTRELLGTPGTGTRASDAAIVAGLLWLSRQQAADGRWMLDGMFKDKGTANDTAGTGLALLPFLGVGKTHKPAKDNLFDKTVGKGLRYLASRQDPKRGDLGGGMYGHAIGTIALSEAYGLTQDPNLRLPAQRAVNFIVYAQHEKGGWRYTPGQEGDLSVTGWQIMALKSAQMAGLDVPAATLKKAERFLDSLVSPTEGYGYIDTNASPTMSAVGLLSRQFLQGWGPQNLRLIKGINANIKPTPPGVRKDAYYYYYATQVMYHFGGDAWKDWNQQMRDLLVKTREDDKNSPNFGSWNSAGDAHGGSGGRLMVTALNLLTLEVYYRYLPLYYRDVAAK
jgi:hypothetical protein